MGIFFNRGKHVDPKRIGKGGRQKATSQRDANPPRKGRGRKAKDRDYPGESGRSYTDPYL